MATSLQALNRPEAEQEQHGYLHTLREIRQQPATWLETARELSGRKRDLGGARAIVLTGSGSSLFAAECAAPFLRERLALTVEAIAAGDLLIYGGARLPAERPLLVVSLARSGESPESAGVVSALLEKEPEVRHLVITANRESTLATAFTADDRVSVITLADAVCDRSLVMTSSFTNLALAAMAFGSDGSYEAASHVLAECAETVLRRSGEIAEIAERPFNRAVFLGAGSNYGAARECALKMLEMTAGRVGTMAETFLGVRHGPMSYINSETALVCFFSENPVAQAYEADLVHELNRKQLGAGKILAGAVVPEGLARPGDLLLPAAELAHMDDGYASLRHVVIGQLLAFFRCRKEGLRPDSPSDDGVIHRVVQSFTLHGFEGSTRS